MATSINTVCVMDAAGHLGSSLVNRLLRRGYTVHAAVQSQDDVSEMMTTVAMNVSGDGKLKAFVADPFDYHSIVDALKGCSGLFYAFEPLSEEANYDESMAEVEVRAAHNVIEACSQVNTIDKVVFTSSVTSIIWRDDHATFDSEFDERHWSSVNLCRKYKLWHALSKTLSEKTAWALAMDREVNMVSVNSGLLISPDLTITNPYLKGAAEMYENGVLVTVDLEFLVDAHICVFEDVSSYGRYVCFNRNIHREEDAMKLAQILTPSAAASTPLRYDLDMKMIQQRISNKKMNKWMVDFVSQRTTEGGIH